MKREKRTTNSSIRKMKKVKKLQIGKNITKLITSGAIFTVLGVGAIYKSTPRVKEYKKPLIGLSISQSQENNDWNLIKRRFKYVIIKIDEKLDDNYMFANNNNMDTGVYFDNEIWKNTYTELGVPEEEIFDIFKEVQERKIDEQLSLLKDKYINWPVYLRLVNDNLENNLPKEYRDFLLETFKSKVESAGLVPGIFTEKEQYDQLLTTNPEIPSNFATWIVSNEKDSSKVIPYLQLSEGNKLLNDDNIDMVQAHQYVLNTGAKDSMDMAPVSYSKIDYYDEQLNYPLFLLGGYSAMKLYDGYELLKEQKAKKKIKKLAPAKKRK